MTRSSVSLNINALLESQLVKRVGVPGSRKEYYCGALDFWWALQEILERQSRCNLGQVLGRVDKTKHAR